MSEPYTIRIFVPDGDPEGAKIIELMNWTGVGIALLLIAATASGCLYPSLRTVTDTTDAAGGAVVWDGSAAGAGGGTGVPAMDGGGRNFEAGGADASGVGDDAPSCVAHSYLLGCVGDGRPDSPTTPASLPTTRCSKNAYTLFKVGISTSSPRSDIARCQLDIIDASGNLVEEYTLPGGTDQSSGTAYGCSSGQTPASLGYLSYSICCADKGPLTFNLVATTLDGTIVQEGTSGSWACSPYPPEVSVLIHTTPRN